MEFEGDKRLEKATTNRAASGGGQLGGFRTVFGQIIRGERRMTTETIVWHPVSEGLPDGGRLLIRVDDGSRASYIDDGVWIPQLAKWHDGDHFIEAEEVTHWAEWPQGPKEGEA
jgi:hypothetical protein